MSKSGIILKYGPKFETLLFEHTISLKVGWKKKIVMVNLNHIVKPT
jgi:hypothetical protein